MFKNKLNEHGEVVINKVRFVSQGYNQQEDIDYTETFSPVARLEAIRLLLSYAVNHGITLYQMNVKSAFLNGVISEEVVKQPSSFEDLKHRDYVFKLKKSLYGRRVNRLYPFVIWTIFGLPLRKFWFGFRPRIFFLPK